MLLSCPFNLDRPANRVLWEITGKCNMNCKHCLYFTTNDNSKITDIPTENVFQIIHQMQNDGSIDEVCLSGGEPLMRNDLLSIIKEITKCGMKPSLSTNGYLVNPCLAENLRDSGVDYVHLSIDGINSEIHDGFRQKRGAFEHVLAAAKYLSNEEIIIGATCIISWFNIDNIKQMVELAISNNIRVLSFYMIEPLGRGKAFNHKLDQSLMLRLSQDYEEINKEFGNSIHLELFRSCSHREPLQDCKCFNFFTITNNGMLGGCPWLMKSPNNPCLYDLKQYQFESARVLLQNSLKEFVSKRKINDTLCENCRWIQSCGKGCPAVSDNSFIDPLCEFMRWGNEQVMEYR